MMSVVRSSKREGTYHGSSHTLEELARNTVTREISSSAHFHGAEDRDIDVASTDHGERLGAVEDGGSRDESDGLLPGIDDITGAHSVRPTSGEMEGSTYASTASAVG